MPTVSIFMAALAQSLKQLGHARTLRIMLMPMVYLSASVFIFLQMTWVPLTTALDDWLDTHALRHPLFMQLKTAGAVEYANECAAAIVWFLGTPLLLLVCTGLIHQFIAAPILKRHAAGQSIRTIGWAILSTIASSPLGLYPPTGIMATWFILCWTQHQLLTQAQATQAQRTTHASTRVIAGMCTTAMLLPTMLVVQCPSCMAYSPIILPFVVGMQCWLWPLAVLWAGNANKR